ncbi:MAG: RNA polymerase sigma factor [Chloroflexota bacterium]
MDSERELVRRCRGGDPEAFRRLVESQHERVYRTAYALTGQREAAQEVVQETFLRAWRGLGRFRGEASLATWLTRLAIAAGTDELGRQRRHRLVRQVLAPPVFGRRDPITLVDQRDELDQALTQLSPKARQVIALRYGLDLSLQEIAATLGCPEGTVKSRLHTALARLREQIRRADPVVAGSGAKEESRGQP